MQEILDVIKVNKIKNIKYIYLFLSRVIFVP